MIPSRDSRLGSALLVCIYTNISIPCSIRPPEFQVPSATWLCDPAQVRKSLSSLRVGNCHGGRVAPTSQAQNEGLISGLGSSTIPDRSRYQIKVSPSSFPTSKPPHSILPPEASSQKTGCRSPFVGKKSPHLPSFLKCTHSTQARA